MCIAGLLGIGVASAGTFTLYSTGFSSTGSELIATSADGNWTLVSTPSGPTTASAYVTCCSVPLIPALNQGPFKNGWIADSTSSEWVSPTKLETSSDAAGTYMYESTFTLDDMFDTAIITGQWAMDNTGYIIVNGTQVTTGTSGTVTTGTTGAFGHYTQFVLDGSNSDFVEGQNTIEFVVTNSKTGNPNTTGLNVDIENTFIVPEPGTFAMMWVGFSGLLFAASKRARR
jgi:hypothetical protein